MNITLREITVGEVFDGYRNDDENGVFGYGGNLNVRPKFQREFVYDDSKQKAVVQTILKGFPLNVMYWSINEDGTYELLDGQQRTLSFCKYIAGDFSIEQDDHQVRSFDNLYASEQKRILDYKLFIYVCDGDDREKLEWFKTINIAGEKLTDQELRNACYTGAWLADAKIRFSKTGCTGCRVSQFYLDKKTIRQELLETAIAWIAKKQNLTIEGYMAKHQHDSNADELWLYFKGVCDWAESKFKKNRKEMKNQPWNDFYEVCKDKPLDKNTLEEEISRLMQDEEVLNKRGVYPYVLLGDASKLNLRAFPDSVKREVYGAQKGICPFCRQEHREKIHYDLSEMEADHVTPWSQGGKTTKENCQMLCQHHNRTKSDR